jgi:histidinol phosphatase-like enzyme
MARLAIDFDGTIHDPFNVKKGYKMGQPIQGAAEAIRQLRLKGHEIIIFPTWADNQQRRQAIVDWLTYFGVEFDDITSVKPVADLYIDNNGYRFNGSWEQALAFVESLK